MSNKTIQLAAAAAFAVLSVTTSGGQRQEQRLRPLEIDEALGNLAFAGRMPIDLSPNGEWVGYTLEDARRHESPAGPEYQYYSRTGAFQEASGCDIWVTNVRTGQSKNLTGARGTSWGPVWSPDGTRLAFYSDRGGLARLWTWEVASGEMREISDAVVRPFFGFASVRWTRDSRQVLLKLLPEGMTVEQAGALDAGGEERTKLPAQASTAKVFEFVPPKTATTTKADGDRLEPSRAERYLSDIALVDSTTGSVRRLARRTRAVGYWISPDGRHVVYSTHAGSFPNTQDQYFDLVLVSLADGASRVIAPRVLMQYGISVSWSPKGDALAFTTNASQRGPVGEAFVVSTTAGATPRKVSGGTHPGFGASYRAPHWDARGDYLYLPAGNTLWRASVAAGTVERVVTLPSHDIEEIVSPAHNIGRYWSPDDGRSIHLVTRDRTTKRAGFARVDLRSGRVTHVLEEEKFYGRDFLYSSDVSEDGRAVLFVAQTARTGDDLWIAEVPFRSTRRLTNVNPRLGEVALGNSRLISWQTAKGTTLQGALFLPAGYTEGTRYPLIVRAYAGSMLSDYVYRFGGHGGGVDNMHLLTSRGYAVLFPDILLRVGTPMTDIAEAVAPALDRVVALGVADPDALGAFGHSYGGYTTLSLIVQIPRIRAAVSSAGAGNLITNYGMLGPTGAASSIGWSETGQGRMGGHPWEVGDRYIKNSPWFFLDRVQTPLLLVNGSLDRPSRPEEIFVGLRRLGKPVTYVLYEGEGHWQGTWSHANVEDYWTRVIAWFDRHLKGGA